jgi:hypothetical protein
MFDKLQFVVQAATPECREKATGNQLLLAVIARPGARDVRGPTEELEGFQCGALLKGKVHCHKSLRSFSVRKHHAHTITFRIARDHINPTIPINIT